MPKTLVIFQDTKVDVIINVFFPYTKGQTVGYFTWAAFLNESETESLSKIRVPYNTEFIVITKANSSMYNLSEIYFVRETPFMIHYGVWDQGNGLKVDRPDFSFYERRVNMNQTLLYSYEFRKSADKILNGYHLEILEDFGKMMNTKIVRVEEAPFGEVTISDLAYVMSDSTYMKDNVGPLLKINSYLYIKEPKITTSDIYFLLPFSCYFWFGLLSFIILATVVNILIRFMFKYKYSEEKIEWIDSAFQTFETFCNQGGGNQSELYTSRVIAYTSSLLFVIVLSAFSAVLQSHLTITISPPPFQNLQELLLDGSYSVGSLLLGYEKLYFQLSSDPFRRHVYKILSKNYVRNIKTGLDRTCNQQRHAQIAYEYDVRMTPVNCKLFQIQDPVITRLTAINFFPHSNGIREVFAYKLLWLYNSGIIHKIQEDLKGFQMEKSSMNYFPVEIDQIPYAMAIVVVGIFLAFVIFIIELALSFCNGDKFVKKMFRAFACEIKSDA